MDQDQAELMIFGIGLMFGGLIGFIGALIITHLDEEGRKARVLCPWKACLQREGKKCAD